MSDKTLKLLIGTNYPSITARLLSPVDGSDEPHGDSYWDIRDAFLAAAESTGAQFYSDGVFLDMEDTSGPEAEALAVGIVVRVLVNRGFTLTIVPDNTPCDGDEDSPPPEPQGDA